MPVESQLGKDYAINFNECIAIGSGRNLKVLDLELVGLSELALVEVRRKIGFIFQAHNLFDSLTAVQNVELAVELGDRRKRKNRKYKQ